jgi:hypothetical protein
VGLPFVGKGRVLGCEKECTLLTSTLIITPFTTLTAGTAVDKNTECAYMYSENFNN